MHRADVVGTVAFFKPTILYSVAAAKEHFGDDIGAYTSCHFVIKSSQLFLIGFLTKTAWFRLC